MRLAKLLGLILLSASCVLAQGGNLGSNATPTVNQFGVPVPSAHIAVCNGLATTAASVSSNTVTLTMASNPTTAGFTVGSTIIVADFTGSDFYLNGSYTATAVGSGTIQYFLAHANATASTNGDVTQQGNTTTACLPLASIYQDPALSTSASNPFQSDNSGNWNVYAAPGNYQVQFYAAGLITTVKPITVDCVPNATSACTGALASNNTWTGSNTFTGNFQSKGLLDNGTTITASEPVVTPTLNNVITPLQYGAKCDGSTDDSTALQNTINAAQTISSATGAVIFIPPGKMCVFGTTLNIAGGTLGGTAPGLRIVGAGPKQTQLVGGSGLEYTGTGNGFVIEGSLGTSDFSYFVSMQNLYFKATAAATSIIRAYNLNGPADFTGDIFDASNVAANAITCSNDCGIQINVHDDFFFGFTGNQVDFRGGGPFSIKDDQFFASPVGVYLSGMAVATVADNYFELDTDAIEIGNDTAEAWGSYDIHGNTFNAGSGHSAPQRCLLVSSTNNSFPFYAQGAFKNNFCNLSNGFAQGLATYNVEFNTSANAFAVSQTWEVENNTFLGAVTSAIHNDNANVSVGTRDNKSLQYYSVSSPAPALTELSGTGTYKTVFSSQVVVPSLNKVVYADQQAGADIGAQINNAYAALPSTGGVIMLSASGSYTQTTPVTFTTVGKPVLLDLNGSTINYSPTTATTAFTLSYGAASPTFLMFNGIVNGILDNNNCATNGGCGSSATGIVTGTTPGVGPNFSGLTIRGFGTGVNAQGGGVNSWGAVGSNFTLLQNTTGLLVGNPYENLSIYGGKIISNATGISTGGSTIDVYAFGTSFDANTTVGVSNQGIFECHGCHFENSNGAGGGVTTHYISSTGGFVSIFGGDWLDDQTTGSTDYWMLSTGSVYINGATFFSGGRTATQVIEINNPGYGYLEYTNNSSGVLTSFVGGTSAGSVTSFDSAAQKFTLAANGSATFNGPLKAAVGPTAIGTAAGLTGTGACATNSTQKGGAWAGQATCTGTTGASTFIITPGTTAPNGWSCTASDLTTSANILRQSAVSTTACTIAGTVNANDVITFMAVSY